MLLVSWIVKSTPLKVDRWFRRLQLCLHLAFSLGHGGNDAQNHGDYLDVVDCDRPLGKTDPLPPMWVVSHVMRRLVLGLCSVAGEL